jgi:hypothetical protein
MKKFFSIEWIAVYACAIVLISGCAVFKNQAAGNNPDTSKILAPAPMSRDKKDLGSAD